MSLSLQNPYIQTKLIESTDCYQHNELEKGNNEFRAICRESKNTEHGVYQKVWEHFKKPTHNPDFGRAAFWNVEGEKTTCREKAIIIAEYMVSIGLIEKDCFQIDANSRMIRWTEKGHRLIDKFEAMQNWHPKTEPWNLLFRVAKVSGSIFAMYYVARKSLDALKSLSMPIYRDSMPSQGVDMVMVRNTVKSHLNRIPGQSVMPSVDIPMSRRPGSAVFLRNVENKGSAPLKSYSVARDIFHKNSLPKTNLESHKSAKLPDHFKARRAGWHFDFFPPEVEEESKDKYSDHKAKKAKDRIEKAEKKGKEPDPKDVDTVKGNQNRNTV